MNAGLIRGLRATAYVLFSATLLWLVWRWFDGAGAWTRLKTASLPWLATALVLLTIQMVASALRWRLTCAQLGLPIARQKAIGQYYVSMLCNLTLPGGVLGDAGRVWHNRGQAGLASSAAAVVLERFAGQLAMVLAFVVGLVWLLRATALTHPLWWIGAIVLIGAAYYLSPRLPRPAWLTRVTTWVSAAWFAPEVRAQQFSLTLLILICNLLAFYACAQAVGASLTAGVALLVLPATLLVMALPVSVAGWGVREAGAALIWPIAGIASDAAVAASVAYGMVATASALPGLWWIRLGAARQSSDRA